MTEAPLQEKARPGEEVPGRATRQPARDGARRTSARGSGRPPDTARFVARSSLVLGPARRAAGGEPRHALGGGGDGDGNEESGGGCHQRPEELANTLDELGDEAHDRSRCSARAVRSAHHLTAIMREDGPFSRSGGWGLPDPGRVRGAQGLLLTVRGGSAVPPERRCPRRMPRSRRTSRVGSAAFPGPAARCGRDLPCRSHDPSARTHRMHW